MLSRCSIRVFLISIISIIASFIPTYPVNAEEALIPFEKFVLDNGLTLIVHEDHKAPIVAVNIWYHVGSRNESPGKTGYAHLFEHLMFQGSENSGGEYLELLEKAGATDLNGTTWFDRTNYYQTVPVNALDRVLFLESDRMGHLLGAIDQAVLDEQRGVVQNEKRQGENQPYSKIWESLLRQVFPVGHPYSWETIGAMEDLEAASLEDMQTWFKTYYGPNNAVLVVAGDIEAKEVLSRVEKYFGDIPAGPPLSSIEEWIPLHTSERRELIQDRVPQERLYISWASPKWGTTEAHHLEIARAILASGKNSRLYERLVYRDQIATDISISGYAFEISGIEIIEASLKKNKDIREAERIIREEIKRLVDDGPTSIELKRIKNLARAAFIRGIERIGGPGSKSAVLAENMVFSKDPSRYQKRQEDIANATKKDIQKVLAKWLSRPPYVADIVPYPEFKTTQERINRDEVPATSSPDAAIFPSIQQDTLSNGLKLLVVNRPTIPDVKFNLIFNAGYSSDKLEKSGLASITMAMLDEGTNKLNTLEISEKLDLLGAQFSAGVGLDTANLSIAALNENLDESLKLFSEIILNPSFPIKELERLRTQYLTFIQQEKVTPISMALRLLPGMLYGNQHPYSQPLTGSGSEKSIGALKQKDLQNWHKTWLKPNNATLVVVGNISFEDIKERVEKVFRNWQSEPTPEINIPIVNAKNNDFLYLIDKPGAEQSIIMAGQLINPVNNPNETAIQVMNDVLGGQFSSRINMNLRENKNWSYGARSLIWSTRGQRPFIMYAPVQTDKTAPALAEMFREISEIRDENPPNENELKRIKLSRTLSLPGRWETNSAVIGAVSELITYQLPLDYWDSFAKNINNLNISQVSEAAAKTLKPKELVWVVIGDKERVDKEIRNIGFEKIKLIDAEGLSIN
ncbi:MAG: pitrilysin family protein [Pseudomonadota bacterium]|nr:pitrilysin family protein [Pseudomonadota bacterium]